MMQSEDQKLIAGGAIFGKLKALGVDYVFANSGTDFPPVIEGLIEAQTKGLDLPVAVVVPHEHAAVGMAHGYYQMSGRMQAVILHTNVGLANGVCGAINAWCDQIPMVLMSGRTPVTEKRRFGARTVPIGWGQEMFDQSAMIREVTKWDYELRFPEQLGELFDRGWAMAQSVPRGPIYLSLPREVLCESTSPEGLTTPSRMTPVIPAPRSKDLAAAADLIARAKAPLVIAQRGVGDAETFAAFADFAKDLALPVSQYWPGRLALPSSHPMLVGEACDDLLAEADVILVIDSLAPWWPDKCGPRADARIIQVGPDPLFSRTPVRNFAADITLPGETGPVLSELMAAVRKQRRDSSAIEARHEAIAARSRTLRAQIIDNAEATCSGPLMTKAWVSLCLSRALKGHKASVFSELGVGLPEMDLDDPLAFFREPNSGGLGWGLPAAIGAQLAAPDRVIVAAVGDGSYMFANPTACHQVAEALSLPVITLVLNNAEWGAVRSSAQGLYHDGLSASANNVPLSSLEPSPDFELTAQASRAHAEAVTEADALPEALERAIMIATSERRQVLLNIGIRKS